MPEAKKGDKVKIHYTAKLKDGKVFDSSEEKEPLEFTIGGQEVIPKLEESIVGMSEGEEKTITMSSDEAYGPRNEELVVELAKDKLPEGMELEEGQLINIETKNMGQGMARVVKLTDSTVVIDANHPLAGQDLEFDLKLVKIV